MDSIKKEVKGEVCVITLNRPQAFNSFNREMALAFQEALDAANHDKLVRAIVIRGEGKAFCAGQDLKEVTSPELNPGFKKILDEHYGPIVKKNKNNSKANYCSS